MFAFEKKAGISYLFLQENRTLFPIKGYRTKRVDGNRSTAR